MTEKSGSLKAIPTAIKRWFKRNRCRFLGHKWEKLSPYYQGEEEEYECFYCGEKGENR